MNRKMQAAEALARAACICFVRDVSAAYLLCKIQVKFLESSDNSIDNHFLQCNNRYWHMGQLL